MAIEAGETTYYQAKRGIVQDGLVLNLDAAVDASYNGGTTWRDLAGSNNGTLTNGPTFDAANGGSLVLDGTNDYITIPNSNGDFDIGTGDFSICLWFYFPSQGSHSYVHLFSFDFQDNFALKAGNAGYGPRAIYFYGDGGYRTFINSFGSWFIKFDTWQYICLTRSGSTHKAYEDGQLLGSVSVSPKSLSCTNAYLGYGNGPTEITSQKRGLTKFYNRALSANEVAQNYNATRHRFGV